MQNQFKFLHHKLLYFPSLNPINNIYQINNQFEKSLSALSKNSKANISLKHSADLTKTNTSFQYHCQNSSLFNDNKAQGSHGKLSKNKSCILIKTTIKKNNLNKSQLSNFALIPKKKSILYLEGSSSSNQPPKQLKIIKNNSRKNCLSSTKPKSVISLHAYEQEKNKFTKLLFDQQVGFMKKKFPLETFLQKMANPHFIDALFYAKVSS